MTTLLSKPEEAYLLRLYVAGQTPKCITAFVNLKKICEEHLAEKYQIEVIDLLETQSWLATTRFWPSPRWCAGCQNQCARSLETCPTRSAFWSAST